MKEEKPIKEQVLEEMKDRYVTSNKPKVIVIMSEAIDLTEQFKGKFGNIGMTENG